MRLSDKCVKCGKCVSVCPSGCISPEQKALDNERCVRCLKCTAVCPVKAVSFKNGKPPRQNGHVPPRFLTGTFTTAAAVGAGVVFAGHINARAGQSDAQRPICPPGAATPEEFAAKCTNCQLCVSACKGKVLRPKSPNYETVHLEYGDNYCLYECNACSNVCPTGAILPLSLPEKQRRRIAMAQFSGTNASGAGYAPANARRGPLKSNKSTVNAKPFYPRNTASAAERALRPVLCRKKQSASCPSLFKAPHQKPEQENKTCIWQTLWFPPPSAAL